MKKLKIVFDVLLPSVTVFLIALILSDSTPIKWNVISVFAIVSLLIQLVIFKRNPDVLTDNSQGLILLGVFYCLAQLPTGYENFLDNIILIATAGYIFFVLYPAIIYKRK